MPDSVKEQVGDVVSRAKRRVGIELPSAADDDGRVGIVRGALRTFADGDMDGFLDALHHDVVWEAPSSGSFPGGGEHEGRDEVKKEFVENAGRTFTSFGFRPETFVDADDADAVLVIGRFEGDGVEGDRVDEAGVQVWEFEGNAVVRVRIFTDSAGFPAVVTERKEREWQEEDKKKEEEEQKKEDEDGEDSAKASAEEKEKDSSSENGSSAKASAEKKDESDDNRSSSSGD